MGNCGGGIDMGLWVAIRGGGAVGRVLGLCGLYRGLLGSQGAVGAKWGCKGLYNSIGEVQGLWRDIGRYGTIGGVL